MRLFCAPRSHAFDDLDGRRAVVLFDRPKDGNECCVGAAVLQEIRRLEIVPAPRAWDFLSIALSVLVADLSGHREKSPDGWTREFDLEIAVVDPVFWNQQRDAIQSALAFLTTDVWTLSFIAGGFVPGPIAETWTPPSEDSVVLLSGGLDSLIGAVDRVVEGAKPIAVSQVVRGDAKHQQEFAQQIGSGLRHFQFNHNAQVPDAEEPPTQRARSLTFLAYGVIAATSVAKYREGASIPLYICENGFIALNPPLTSARLGSLSTRTAHPRFLRGIQGVLDAAGLRAQLANPYSGRTKGEMLARCRDQDLVGRLASSTTSCGRFLRYGYRHCGRCVPCQIRRAAFHASTIVDSTTYVYEQLGKDDEDHRAFDDVRSAAMAILEAREMGVEDWLGSSIAWVSDEERALIVGVVDRGLRELGALHEKYQVA